LAVFVYSQVDPEQKWTTLQPAGESFQIEMPAKVISDNSLDKTHRRYFSAVKDTFFAIFSEKAGKEKDYKKALEFIHAHEQSGRKTMIGSFEGERFDFVDSDGFRHKAISLSTGQRSYIFQAISPVTDSPLVAHFFNSLKIDDVKALAEESTDSTAPNALDAAVKSGAGLKTPVGFGSGSGSGRSAPSTVMSTSATTMTGATTPLNILAKPRAAYTDLARLYWIQGSVILKVTLLASGEIGSVTTVTKLPFGLTQTAITAARSIQFNPKMVNGVPVSVTKTVEYNFNIY